MNEVLTLQKEARSILREVLNEKDLAIEELTRQIIQYQSQLQNFGEKFQTFQRNESLSIDQHNIEALMNAGFIKNEDSQFHILIDITQIIHQKIDVIKLDSKIQIIKEVSSISFNANKQFNDAYELLRNQNNILLKQMSEKDKEQEKIINSLKDMIKKNKDEYDNTIAEYQSKINKIEEQYEIIQMESDQITQEKIRLNQFVNELRDKYQQKLKQCEQYASKITELTIKNETLFKENNQLSTQSLLLKKNNEQIIEEQKQIKQKYEELELQYNKFVTSSQDNDSFTKQRELESINHKKQLKSLQQKIKNIEKQCQSLKTQNQKYIDQLKKIEGYQVVPSVQNIMDLQVKGATTPEREKPKDKRKGKKMIRVGY